MKLYASAKDDDVTRNASLQRNESLEPYLHALWDVRKQDEHLHCRLAFSEQWTVGHSARPSTIDCYSQIRFDGHGAQRFTHYFLLTRDHSRTIKTLCHFTAPSLAHEIASFFSKICIVTGSVPVG